MQKSQIMILAVDVDYKNTTAHIAGIAFTAWQDAEPLAVYTSTLSGIENYVSGEFYKRELPCILNLLEEHSLKPECIIIDGYVYLDGVEKPGLGKHLYDVLKEIIIVIGVAKQPFKDIPKFCKVYRGHSKKPIYVTAEGLLLDDAKHHICSMHGEFRIPALLKMADQACRAWEK